MRFSPIPSASLTAFILVFSIGTVPVQSQIKTVELTISGSPEPVPSLAYRLLHNHAELKPGDAAPIYTRINVLMSPERMKDLKTHPKNWFDRPIDATTYPEVRDYVKSWASQLQQIEFGAARRDCSWNYTLDEQRENAFEILLPDAQQSRQWMVVLNLKARAEIYEERYVEAAKTIRTSIAFGRHVGQGPFSVNGLFGFSMLGYNCIVLEEWVSKPDSPNLYWALTALPRPLLSMRTAVEQELILPKLLLPEMVVGPEPLTVAEWDARLVRLHKRIIALRNKPSALAIEPEIAERSKKTLEDYREWILPEARKFAESHPKMKFQSDSQLIVTYIWQRYQELYDDLFKSYYLPLAVSDPFHREAMRNLYKTSKGPLWFLYPMLGNVEGMYSSEAHLERRIAILRIIEALRLHLQTSSKLPETLAELKIVPIPADPWTDRAFDYEVSGDIVSLGNFKEKNGYNFIYKIKVIKD
jgi:hypothetical protein